MPRKPNIVVLMCVQLGAGALPAYGHPLVRSPHIDAIAARGTVLDDFRSISYVDERICEVLEARQRTKLTDDTVVVFYTLSTGRVTPWNVQSWEVASKRHYRGGRSYHEAEERDRLGP